MTMPVFKKKKPAAEATVMVFFKEVLCVTLIYIDRNLSYLKNIFCISHGVEGVNFKMNWLYKIQHKTTYPFPYKVDLKNIAPVSKKAT